MSDHIYSVECPDCERTCWVNNGDVTDLTACDVEAVECPFCEWKWLLEGCEDWTTLEDANLYKAGKSPNEVV